MATVEEFRGFLGENEVSAVIDKFIMVGGAAHVTEANIEYIRSSLSKSYGTQIDDTAVWITGSAKLGFSISEKTQKDGDNLPRYRPFRDDSDIDVAVISAPIFNLVWQDLADHSHRAAWFPRDAGKLGDYLVVGWLRPDHFPKHSRLRRCDDWWDAFRQFSADPRFDRRKVRGGLFQSSEHFRKYVARSVSECIREERSPK